MATRFNSTLDRSQRARTLRGDMTDAEKTLWRHLRSRQVVGARFRRQHPIGPYVVDFCAPTLRLIIELDGGQHAEQERVAKDAARTAWLSEQGFRVLRFWNNDIFGNLTGVVDEIAASVNACSKTIPSLPSPFQGEG